MQKYREQSISVIRSSEPILIRSPLRGMGVAKDCEHAEEYWPITKGEAISAQVSTICVP